MLLPLHLLSFHHTLTRKIVHGTYNLFYGTKPNEMQCRFYDTGASTYVVHTYKVFSFPLFPSLIFACMKTTTSKKKPRVYYPPTPPQFQWVTRIAFKVHSVRLSLPSRLVVLLNIKKSYMFEYLRSDCWVHCLLLLLLSYLLYVFFSKLR